MKLLTSSATGSGKVNVGTCPRPSMTARRSAASAGFPPAPLWSDVTTYQLQLSFSKSWNERSLEPASRMGNERGLAGTRGECVDETITNFHEYLPDYAVRASNGANGSVNALASTATGRRRPDDEGLAVLQPVRRQGR